MGLRHEKITEPAVEEILIQDLVSEHPRLMPSLSSPPVLHYCAQPGNKNSVADPPASKT
jgi:hypothetical protein